MRAFAGAATLLLHAIICSASLAAADPQKSAAPEIKHTALGNDWFQAESEHFRVVYTKRALAEQVVATAEKAREKVTKTWFGGDEPKWPGKCDIYLHRDGDAYSKATGAPASSPGHSSITAEKGDASRLISLRIDLHIDHPDMVSAVLPHEVTHVTIAGKFGKKHIPRWTDEGIAVLSEPDDKVNRHLMKIDQFYKDKLAFSAGDLMQLADYPAGNRVAAFYAQSVSLVKFLAAQKDPTVLPKFVRAAQVDGYEKALKAHYGFDSLDALDAAWRKSVQSKDSSR